MSTTSCVRYQLTRLRVDTNTPGPGLHLIHSLRRTQNRQLNIVSNSFYLPSQRKHTIDNHNQVIQELAVALPIDGTIQCINPSIPLKYPVSGNEVPVGCILHILSGDEAIELKCPIGCVAEDDAGLQKVVSWRD